MIFAGLRFAEMARMRRSMLAIRENYLQFTLKIKKEREAAAGEAMEIAGRIRSYMPVQGNQKATVDPGQLLQPVGRDLDGPEVVATETRLSTGHR
jgi:hypothetical protein